MLTIADGGGPDTACIFFILIETMTASNNQTVYRLDYKAPAFLTDHVDLDFELVPDDTIVTAATTLHRNPDSKERDLVLLGSEPELLSISMNGETLDNTRYDLGNGELRIKDAPDTVKLVIKTRIHPDKNTSLMGLYVSNGNFFTQCEAEGFRKITYFQDRPDVMATYTVRLAADKTHFPVLLSNGNLIDSGDLPENRHYAVFEDPFRKPSYR